MDSNTITIIGSTAVLIIGALSGAALAIIKAINDGKRITIAAQEVGATNGVVRDKKIQQIHILSNSRLTAALNLIVIMARKEFQRTGSEEDRRVYMEAKEEYEKSKDNNERVESIDENDPDVIAAHRAELKFAEITDKIKDKES